ncbi:MAG: hypothetical protein AB1540_08465 [Bdellovibrionota bacterium]
MISYPVYKVIHLTGILMIFLSLGGALLRAASPSTQTQEKKLRKQIAITHGVGLFLALLGGFGLLARIGVVHGQLPGWVWGKLSIWVFMALALFAAKKLGAQSRALWWLALGLGGTAAWLAGYKPF